MAAKDNKDKSPSNVTKKDNKNRAKDEAGEEGKKEEEGRKEDKKDGKKDDKKDDKKDELCNVYMEIAIGGESASILMGPRCSGKERPEELRPFVVRSARGNTI